MTTLVPCSLQTVAVLVVRYFSVRTPTCDDHGCQNSCNVTFNSGCRRTSDQVCGWNALGWSPVHQVSDRDCQSQDRIVQIMGASISSFEGRPTLKQRRFQCLPVEPDGLRQPATACNRAWHLPRKLRWSSGCGTARHQLHFLARIS